MIPEAMVLKLLRIAMGYGSRTERIQRMLNCPDLGVQMMARSLMTRGLLNRSDGTVKSPELDKN